MKLESVELLIAEGHLHIEDGNHGEYRPRPEEFVEAGVKYIRAADMSSGVVEFDSAQSINDAAVARIRKGVGRPGDTILSHKGTLGRVAVAPADSPPFVCSPQTTFWRSLRSEVLDSRYLAYALRSPYFQRQLVSIGSESDMAPYVSLGSQKRMSLPLPSIRDQAAIGRLLSSMDEKISASRSVAQRSDELLRALYGRLAVSELTLGDIAVNRRESVNPINISANEVYVGLEHVDRRSLWLKSLGAGSRVTSSKLRFDINDTLFGKLRPYFHKVSLAHSSGVCSTDILVIRPVDSRNALLVAAAASSDEVVATAVQASNGTKMPRANWADIASCPIPDPASIEARAFCAAGGAVAERATQAMDESSRLAATRDELLPLLMSGKITVKDAEKIVEEVV